MNREERRAGRSRRELLSALAGLAAAPALAGLGAGSEDAVGLGGFGSEDDGWRPVDGTELTRIERGPWSTAASDGERALRATADGATVPAINRPADALELLETPYLTADVVPGVAGFDGPVAFEFRLARGGDARDREVVARSDSVAVRQAVPGRVYWDASAVDPLAAGRATHLEIAWYPASRDRVDDPDGGAAAAPYRGAVIVDAVRASAAPDAVAAARFVRTIRRLEAEHGSHERTEVTERGSTTTAGRFVFADGATEPVRFASADDGGFRLTVADEAVEFEGGV